MATFGILPHKSEINIITPFRSFHFFSGFFFSFFKINGVWFSSTPGAYYENMARNNRSGLS